MRFCTVILGKRKSFGLFKLLSKTTFHSNDTLDLGKFRSHPTREAYNELNRVPREEATLNVEPSGTQPRRITISTVALQLVQHLVEGLCRR